MLSTQDIAARYAVTPRRILAIAAARGLKPARTVGRSHLWSPAQAERLRPGPIGRPQSGAPQSTTA